MSRIRQFLPRLALMLLVTPLAGEVLWRVGYALRFASADYLRFPHNTAFSSNVYTGGALEGGDAAAVVLQRPGTFTHVIGDQPVAQAAINAMGFRGPDLSVPTAGLRVVAVGGSSTFSPECGEGLSWPERLSGHLSTGREGPPVTVYNAGALGADSTAVRWVTDKLVLPHRPDVLLVSSAYNDVLFSGAIVDLSPLRAPWHRRTLWGRSLLYTAVTTAWSAHRRESGGQRQDVLARYRDNLEAIVLAAQDQGAAVVFIAQPILGPDRIEPAQSFLAKRGGEQLAASIRSGLDGQVEMQRALVAEMASVAQEQQVPWIDVREQLEQPADAQQSFVLFLHLTESGADRFARLVAEALDALPPGEWGAG